MDNNDTNTQLYSCTASADNNTYGEFFLVAIKRKPFSGGMLIFWSLMYENTAKTVKRLTIIY